VGVTASCGAGVSTVQAMPTDPATTIRVGRGEHRSQTTLCRSTKQTNSLDCSHRKSRWPGSESALCSLSAFSAVSAGVKIPIPPK